MTIEKKLTITDFKEGTKAPCGLEQTQQVNGQRSYPQQTEYRNLADLGIKEAGGVQIPRDIGNSR